jgi:hypothetical protein
MNTQTDWHYREIYRELEQARYLATSEAHGLDTLIPPMNEAQNMLRYEIPSEFISKVLIEIFHAQRGIKAGNRATVIESLNHALLLLEDLA